MNPSTRQLPASIDLVALEAHLSSYIVRDAPAKVHVDEALNNAHASLVGKMKQLEHFRPGLTERDAVLFLGLLTILARVRIVRHEDGAVSTADMPILKLLLRRSSEGDYAIVNGILPGKGWFEFRMLGGGRRYVLRLCRYPGPPRVVHSGGSRNVWSREVNAYSDALWLVQEIVDQGGVYVVSAALGDSHWSLLVQSED